MVGGCHTPVTIVAARLRRRVSIGRKPAGRRRALDFRDELLYNGERQKAFDNGERQALRFEELKLDRRILDAVADAGYVTPSPIQEKAIPPALEGRDVLGCAQTGTGKTAAFSLPVLNRMTKSPRGGIRALILTPTRELALQIDESIRAYGKYLPYRCGVLIGGIKPGAQIEMLKKGVDILVSTPGRLLDLHAQGYIRLDGLAFFVLDEADRMLDMGFIHDVRKVIALLPKKRQTMFFTATMPPEIAALAQSLLYKPVSVAVNPISSTVDLTEQIVYYTDKASKTELLTELFGNGTIAGSALVFTRTKYGADKLARKLKKAGIEAMAIHGDKTQGARQNALDSFKKGRIRALIATDIAARGIDIEDLPYVVNYELPNVPETYVHRIGRTGRAGKTCADVRAETGRGSQVCPASGGAEIARIVRL